MLRSGRPSLFCTSVTFAWLLLSTTHAPAQTSSAPAASSSGQAASPTATRQETPALHIFNVREFGAAGDGKTKDTAAITRAIQATNQAGGGEVVFPSGTYLTGTVEILSNVTLNLQRSYWAAATWAITERSPPLVLTTTTVRAAPARVTKWGFLWPGALPISQLSDKA